ncbi:gas vesicle protein GvpO [Pseudonocardia sp. TRM90224]|uniref:gas vesicle protein GvpO n=1 Tax=Pseudonocardia sp. TRM90224 TaxID=2812678 RepID=UPI0027DF333D|nr:gas vesicle protein [Pseudonocardia sp. TRM90224]
MPDEQQRAPARRPRRRRMRSAAEAARTAAAEVAALTGRDPESVISVEPCDEGWLVGVEVVETHRIPDSADILATYEVRLEPDGELMSYRRNARYPRGRMSGPNGSGDRR